MATKVRRDHLKVSRKRGRDRRPVGAALAKGVQQQHRRLALRTVNGVGEAHSVDDHVSLFIHVNDDICRTLRRTLRLRLTRLAVCGLACVAAGSRVVIESFSH